jgi:hypothetical protein
VKSFLSSVNIYNKKVGILQSIEGVV